MRIEMVWFDFCYYKFTLSFCLCFFFKGTDLFMINLRRCVTSVQYPLRRPVRGRREMFCFPDERGSRSQSIRFVFKLFWSLFREETVLRRWNTLWPFHCVHTTVFNEASWSTAFTSLLQTMLLHLRIVVCLCCCYSKDFTTWWKCVCLFHYLKK